MKDIKRFQRKDFVPTAQLLGRTWQTIDDNLKEMEIITSQVAAKKDSISHDDLNGLFYLGSCLYDYYQLAEECFLVIARTLDKWVPSSLDWHEQLVKQLQQPIPESRPPLLSAATAGLLSDYLYFHLTFHRRCSSLSFSKVEIMAANLEALNLALAKEIRALANFLLMLRQAGHGDVSLVRPVTDKLS